MSDPLYKIGTVIQWSDGKRSSVIGVTADLVYRMDALNGVTFTVSEEYVLADGFQTIVQPEQIYQAPVHRYKVLAPVANYRWTCHIESLGVGFPDMQISEFDLLSWILIEGLDPAPSRRHGPHTCPRCGHGGALIMAIRTVYCTNSKCPCYAQP